MIPHSLTAYNLQPLPTLRAVAAVALLSLRAAVRSRVVLMLVLVLAAGVVGLPHMIVGDGSPASDLHIRLRYTLAFGTGILGLATLWASCAAFAVEIDSRRIELTAVKPVQPLTLWLGRWLGILLLDAVLLAAVVAGVRWQLTGTRPDGSRRDAALFCRTVARPVLPAPEVEARSTYEGLKQRGRLPPGLSAEAVLRQLTINARSRCTVVQPAEHATWTFRPDCPVPADGRLWLRLRFDAVRDVTTDVRGVCRLRRTGQTAWAAEVAVNDLTLNQLELAVQAPALAGARELEMAFEYQAPPQSAALLIRPRQELAVLIPAGSFTVNLIRVWLAHLAILAALAALGLTFSACFSFPVAAFSASALLVVVLVSTGGIAEDEAAMEDDSHATTTLMERISMVVVSSADLITAPMLNPEPLAQAAAGERVPDAELGRLVVWGGIVYPLILALLAAGVLRRREMVR